MDDPRSVVPIFFASEGRQNFEQIGSGVLLSLGGEVFLLTVAHITDRLEEGTLLVPGRNGIIPANGHSSYVPKPTAGGRASDRIDIAYLRLAPETMSELHPGFSPLSWQDLGIFETLHEGDLYTFVGFPAKRARIRAQSAESEIFKFTGGAASDATYAQLGYDPSLHIAMMFNRRKAIVGNKIQAAIHPRGLSGGGIFSWSKRARTDPSVGPPKRLVGIVHAYHEPQGCMVGTRINGYLAAIFRNNPHLEPVPHASGARDAPLVTGIAWYRAEDWAQLKAEFEDSEHMHATWHEWREAAQKTVEQMRLRGVHMVPVELTAREISEYCSKAGRPNISRTRNELVSRRLRDATLNTASE